MLRNENGFAWRLFGFFFVLYVCTSSWAIRSSDGEIVYRAAEAMARHGTFAIEKGCRWEGFGLATGTDGRRYSIFAPLPSFLLTPLVWAADRCFPDPETSLTATATDDPWTKTAGSWWKPARSLWLEDGAPLAAHARRMIIGPYQALICAGIIGLFQHIVVFLTGSFPAAGLASLLLGLGTLLWPYAGLCFSEPLAMLLLLFSIRAWLMRAPGRSCVAASVSGAWIGLAATAHLTSLLFIPFLGAWVLAEVFWPQSGHHRDESSMKAHECGDSSGSAGSDASAEGAEPGRSRSHLFAAWIAGLMLPLLGLGLLQFLRYGSPFETGRTVDPEAVRRFAYGFWSFQWSQIHGLLFGAGKGLFLFCPLLLIAIGCWRFFWRCRPALATAIAGAAVFRILFIAARSDWHGGFSLGPRYLVPLIPLLLISIGCGLSEALRSRRKLVFWTILVVGCVAVSQQWYFCIGDIFQYSRAVREFHQQNGHDMSDLVTVFDDWETTPLAHLHQARCVIWAVGWWPFGNLGLWLAGSALLVFFLVRRGLSDWRIDR